MSRESRSSSPAARARANTYGVPDVYPSVELMLGQLAEHLDAVDVATPRETHAPICRLAADRGLAILCQKPLAPTFDEAVSLVSDVGGRARLMVHENWRFRPHYRRIARWLRDDRIGAVHTAAMTLFTSGLVAEASGRAPAIERQPVFATLPAISAASSQPARPQGSGVSGFWSSSNARFFGGSPAAP